MSAAIPIRGGPPRRTSSARFSSPPKMGRQLSLTDSPRPLVPQETNVFTFDAHFREKWALPPDLQQWLPDDVAKKIDTLQQAGATVLTCLDRLEKAKQKLPEETTTETLKESTSSDAIAAKLKEYEERRNRSSSIRDTTEYDCVPIPHEWRYMSSNSSYATSPQAVRSRGGSSGSSSGTRASPSFSPITPATTSFPAMTPLDLGEAHSFGSYSVGRRESDARPLPSMLRRDSEASHSTLARSAYIGSIHDAASRPATSRRGSHSVIKAKPLDAHSSQYYAELEYLRKVALVSLRHAKYPVEKEWKLFLDHENEETKAKLNPKDSHVLLFEEWWLEKKQFVNSLEETIKDMCAGIQFSLGWSDTPGLETPSTLSMPM